MKAIHSIVLQSLKSKGTHDALRFVQYTWCVVLDCTSMYSPDGSNRIS